MDWKRMQANLIVAAMALATVAMSNAALASLRLA
jgi:hypothetical protein